MQVGKKHRNEHIANGIYHKCSNNMLALFGKSNKRCQSEAEAQYLRKSQQFQAFFLMNDHNSTWYFVPPTEDVALTTNDERCLPFILHPRSLFFFLARSFSLSLSLSLTLSFAFPRCLCVGWARWQTKMVQMLAAVHFTVVIAVENLPCQTFSLDLMSKTE